MPTVVAGGVLGWMYGLLSETNKLLSDSENNLDKITQKLRYQEDAFNMLLNSRHMDTMSQLLEDSLKTQCRNIAFVNENKYLDYLQLAIKESRKYFGVQRHPVRWFNENNRLEYLKLLKSKSMESKIRIFLIDDNDIDKMAEDINDSDIMTKYWESTGEEVKTFWISTEDFKKEYRTLNIPDDFALYDEELIIRYQIEYQTLTFDLLEKEENLEKQILARIENQIKNDYLQPFQKITPLARS